MKIFIKSSLLILLFFKSFVLAVPVYAQKLPKEDVIEVPEISEGLCVSNVFQSNMVLQRDKPIQIWGWADIDKEVVVTFAGQDARAIAEKDRRWKVTLPAMKANESPQQMFIKGMGKTIVLENILLGDIWILGGQSNMEFELAKVENGRLEIVTANYPKIRVLTVPQGVGPENKTGFARLDEWSDWFGQHYRKGSWDECTPKVAEDLSAIGYVFVRRIHMGAKVPIGVIDVSRGGTTVETWTPLNKLRTLNSQETKQLLLKADQSVKSWDPEQDLKKRIDQHKQWIERQTKAGTTIPAEKKLPPTDLRPGPAKDANFPGNCYAGMLAPLAGLSVKGAIFHQGYNNAFNGSQGAEMYRDIFPVMIKSWREAFNDPQLPFGIISLCTETYPQTKDNYCENMFNAGVEIREAHYQVFLNLAKAGDKNIGFADSYDLRRRWYHPQLKIPAGERIARWALATQYGFQNQIEWKPPMILEMKPKDNSLTLTFDMEVGDPEDGEMLGFAICGNDRKFHPAKAEYAIKNKEANGKIQYDRKQLILTSIMVDKPVHYRFAWGRNPLANIQITGNKDIPLPTQRSDTWNMEEIPAGIFNDKVALPLSGGDRAKILQALREQDRLRRLREAELVIKNKGELKATNEE